MSACQSTQVSTRPDTNLADQDAYALLRQAEAQVTGSKRGIDLRLLAAQVFNLQQAPSQALAAVAPLLALKLPDGQADNLARVMANAWYAMKRFTEAEQAIAGITRLTGEDMLLLANICSELGDYRCSADGYIQASLDPSINADVLPEDLNDRIWLALSRARKAPAVFTDPVHHAWWLLQEKIRTAGSITGQIAAWRNWQARYPNHPARTSPPRALQKLDEYRTPQVGLLLPISGPYGAAGSAVRDGLIAAFLSEQADLKPEIRVYDTGEASVGALYEQALREGATVLVGPLIREEVEEFARITQYANTPRLVLNYLNGALDDPSSLVAESGDVALASPVSAQPTAAPLFQFGIAIEDEAESLANHVLLTGAERLLVVHSQARWSQRALNAYRDAWPFPITRAPFTDIKGLTGAVGEAMQVAASEERKNEIANILGQRLEFLPRARGDLDAVIALTSYIESQALVPALRFHFADDLPVYATSQAARGDDLARLAGFELTEMPLFTEPDENQRALSTAFSLPTNPFAELYALGYDAYRIATWLPILDHDAQVALPAATGYLWLERGGKFRRDLAVSRIDRQGKPVPLD